MVIETRYTARPRAIGDLAGGYVGQTWDAVHGATRYEYYRSTNLAAGGVLLSGLVKRVTYSVDLAEARSESFIYDGQRHLQSSTDEYGLTTYYQYDALGRVTSVRTQRRRPPAFPSLQTG